MAQRKLDVVLDSVKRLQRMGATANLVNLLQKQHPADLAQLFSELPDKDRRSAFSLLVERNSRLAMEGLSELGPEAGAALLAERSADEIVKLVQDLPTDDAAAIIDYLPEELSAAVLELMQKRPAGADVGELLEYEEQTAGRIMNPKVFALAEDMTAGEAITALQGSRDVEVVFYLYVIDPRRGRGEQAGWRDHGGRRDRRHQGRGDGGRLSPGRPDRRRSRVLRPGGV